MTPSGDGTLANHLDHLERAHIDRAVVCPIATKPNQFDVIFRRACDILSGAKGARAQRLLVPFASVHPQDPDGFAHVEQVAAAGLRGLKFHPCYQNFSLADPSVWPLFRKIASLGLVVQCHAGLDRSSPSNQRVCGPAEIATLLRNVPNLTFIAAHLGGCEGAPPHATDALLDLGCYIDTSALVADRYKDEQMRLLRSWPRERLLFGTDFPWADYGEALRWVRSLRAPEDLADVLGGNAARLLGL